MKGRRVRKEERNEKREYGKEARVRVGEKRKNNKRK